MTRDPYSLMREPDWGEHDEHPFEAAIAAFDPLAPEGLRSLLLDDDPIIRSRGLFVFGYLGRKAFVVLDAALKSVDIPDAGARSGLMDGVICYSKQLNPQQAHVVLKLADDPADLVREKVVAFLGAALPDTIESAIELFEEPVRSVYSRGFAKFGNCGHLWTSLESCWCSTRCKRSRPILVRLRPLPKPPFLMSADLVGFSGIQVDSLNRCG